MILRELMAACPLRLITPDADTAMSVNQAYAGDRMSDLLHHVSEDTLLITHIANRGLVRLIELMDAPAICLVNGAEPDEEVREAAEECGCILLVSSAEMFETCGRIHAALRADLEKV
jgi:predicted transcriptional regulator